MTDKPTAHLLACWNFEALIGEEGNKLTPYVWCSLDMPRYNITIVLSPRDATHQGMQTCEACLMARDT